MPAKCSVPGCSSNYKRKEASEEYVTVFSFPKQEHLRDKWIRSIHRENLEPNEHSVVCIQHFSEDFIIREDRMRREDGTELVIPRKRPKFIDDACPTIFSGQPSYMTTNLPKKRKAPTERRLEIEERTLEQEKQKSEDDKIHDFADFTQRYQALNNNTSFFDISKQHSVVFIKIDVQSAIPRVHISLEIHSNLTVSITCNNLLVPTTKYKQILGNFLLCDTWTKFRCLIATIDCTIDVQMTIQEKLDAATILLKEVVAELEPTDMHVSHKLSFYEEQVSLLLKKQPRYSPDLLIWACTLFYSYPAAYRQVRHSALNLPHPTYLKKLASRLGTESAGVGSSHLHYLTEKLKLLADHEKIVNVLLDEIYVKAGLHYKSGKIEGQSEIDSKVTSTTVQAFMVTSIFSKNKDVVGLFPVQNLTASDLLNLTLEVIRVLTKAGYTVLSLISDNNRVNRLMFEKLCGGKLEPSFKNPDKDDEDIFLLFDSVHLMKNIRNNWINQRDSEQTMVIPSTAPTCDSNVTVSISDESDRMFSGVSHLRTIYEEGKHDIVKLAPMLSRKVLYPSNLERQNVNYALRLFDEKTIAALKVHKSERFEGTISFLEVIGKWWKIVNVKHFLKGKHLRDPFCDSIRSPNDKNLTFLINFSQWLETWEGIHIQGASESSNKVLQRSGKLTKETYTALKHTTNTLVLLSRYLLTNVKCKFVLLGKFQTDHLEARFGQYRQMSGGNYNVSVIQVLETEKKLRLISLVSLKSANSGNFELKLFLDNCSSSAENDRLNLDISELFEDVTLHSDFVNVTQDCEMALAFVAGYVARGVGDKVKCVECSNVLLYSRTMELDCDTAVFQYLKVIDRGGLKWPKAFVVNTIVDIYKLFQTLISEEFESKFLESSNQRSLIQSLAVEKYEMSETADLESNCVSCGVSRTQLVEKMSFIFANIVLNNYCKGKNNTLQEDKLEKKKLKKCKSRKLNTLEK